MATAGGATFDEVFALCPALHARYREFIDLFSSRRAVDPALLDLCHRRVAELLGCAHPSDEDQPTGAALAGWREAPGFQPVERAALAFTEKFVLAPHEVTDDDVAALTRHLPVAEVVALTEALAVFDGFTRFRTMLGIG